MSARDELLRIAVFGASSAEDADRRIDAYRAEVLREARDMLLGEHIHHRSGSTDCIARCERAHPNVEVCNSDDYRWPCPTVDKMNSLLGLAP